ncbi:hypothetical protein [Mesorhizobium sp. SARCC-RB16n]|uniref:hypothetical protein n=1 Tax=Mesorhizobium sp. SARCC-RB16n TaxID=2116687 RepID=UPI00122F30B2|nr:hypothetical protein [Mesorhizobium sp. SARCC-RB16n]
MPADRLRVREVDGAFEVHDGDDVIGTFATIVEARRAVRERGARLWLDWGRTVIGGQTAPYDFSASFLGSDSIGRIRGQPPSAGKWLWSIGTHDNRWRKHGGLRQNSEDIRQQLQQLSTLPFRMNVVEGGLTQTNLRMDQYLQMLGTKIDGMRDRVHGLSTKVEVLSQKIDAISPQKRAEAGSLPCSNDPSQAARAACQTFVPVSVPPE